MQLQNPKLTRLIISSLGKENVKSNASQNP